MTALKLLDGGLITVITGGAALATGTAATGDYSNSTNLYPIADLFLRVAYGALPTVGTAIAELYALPGDGGGPDVFPAGGTALDPQKTLLVGVFETRAPSLTVDEILVIQAVPLRPTSTRFILKNISGQAFNTSYLLDLRGFLGQAV